ncbi:HlyD family secretion protein [Fundidesulfovibrio soli]|uniref:HlyD family secretion protein n=1 Tax=Fundidesulfovibrio soli TaxID=2922716 RepID=UPI001FAFC29A|nr:HlyD family secretion protein [Fundidesulfovibrio soli]
MKETSPPQGTSPEREAAPNDSIQPSRPRRRLPKALLLLLAAAGLAYGGHWWWAARAFETTDDAFVTGRVTNLAPQVAGRVLEVLVEDNQKVEKGQLLARIDPASFSVRLHQAEADLAEAQQKLAEAQAQHQSALASVEQAKADSASAEAQAANAATDLTRYNQLVQSGAVSQQARDNADTLSRTNAAGLQSARKRQLSAQAQADLAAARIQTAQAGVDKAKAALEQARLDLSYTEIASPVAARVTKKALEPGDYVQVGQAVMSLVQDGLWVVANFKETQLKGMKPGQPVSLVIDAYPDRTFNGRVESLQAGTGAVFSLLPPQNASGNYVKVVQRVPVKIVFDALPGEAEMHLAPGMSVVPTVKVR